MKKTLLIALFVLAIPLLLAQEITNVETLEIRASKVEKIISKVGTVTPFREVIISALNEGLVEKLSYEEGQKVNKGKSLAHIGASDYKLNLDEVQNSLRQQQVNFNYNKKNYTRQKTFFEKGIINQAQFEQIESQYNLSQIAVSAARIRVQRARRSYNYSTLPAPISGVIDKKFIEIGEFARKGDRIYSLMEEDKLKVEFVINESELEDFSIQQQAKLKFDALPNQEYTGAITKISSSANTQTKTFQVEISLNNPENKIRPGITARISMNISKAGNNILIPLAAIVEGTKGKIVYLDKDGRAKEVGIIVEENIGSQALVTQGLSIGDKLIVKGHQFLNDGVAINDINQVKMNFAPSNFAIKKATVFFILILLTLFLGLTSYKSLPREWAPDVQIPILIVSTPYIGASPEDIESSITQKLEKKFNNIEGLKKLNSTSAQGVSIITLEFDIGF